MRLFAQIDFDLPVELMAKGCDWRERAVYVEAILHVRQRLTDGVIHRTLLATWMQDLPTSKRVKMLDALTRKGALEEHPDGWAFPAHVWARWGRNRADVEATREQRKQAGRRGNHRRWHLPETGGTPSPDCPWCIEDGIANGSQTDRTVRDVCDRTAIANRSQNDRTPIANPSPETETETETETSSFTSVRPNITSRVPAAIVQGIDTWADRRRMP